MDIMEVKRLREDLGIKACDVAKAIGMDKGNYSSWEAGKKEYRRKGWSYLATAVSYLRSCATSRAEVLRQAITLPEG